MSSQTAVEVSPAFGQKTIKLQINLFTEGIAEAKGKILPGHAHRSGSLAVIKNPSHGLVAKTIFFKDVAEIPAIIANEIKLI